MDEELKVLKEAPGPVASFSKYMEELKVAELLNDDRKMEVAVSKYRDETIGMVWRAPEKEAASGDSEVTERETPKQKTVPEEVSGSDPEDVPVYPDAVRTAYKELKEGDRLIREVSYAAPAETTEVKKFIRKGTRDKGWKIEKEMTKNGAIYLELAKGENQLEIGIEKSDEYEGHTEIQLILQRETEAGYK